MKNDQSTTVRDRIRAARAISLLPLVAVLLGLLATTAGARAVEEEMTEGEAMSERERARAEILAKTVTRPGGQEWALGTVGGTWLSAINNDPKTFNTMSARDGDTATVVDVLFDSLADYDPYTREFLPNLASFEVEVDEEADTLTVVYTLRDDLYWTTLADPDTRVQVTADDVVFWYDEIEGDQELQQPGYAGQFIEMPDGSEARIEVEKLDEFTVAFHYPRIVANPILSTNMDFGPRYVYEPAKSEGGAEGVLNLFSVDTDPTTIPSVGEYYLTEYEPGVRVVAERNPNYWKKDAAGVTLPYIEKLVFQIVPDWNTELLLFKEGKKDSFTLRPEDMDELLNAEDPDYTVYNGGPTLGSAFISFNQNPDTMDPLVYSWFSQTRFRQAMSSVLNRDRIASQVYRGLAEPALHFFARANPYFDESIRQEFDYDPDRARDLLAEIGIRPNADGLMEDADGNHVEFDIHVGAENNVGVDIMNIFSDELKVDRHHRQRAADRLPEAGGDADQHLRLARGHRLARLQLLAGGRQQRVAVQGQLPPVASAAGGAVHGVGGARRLPLQRGPLHDRQGGGEGDLRRVPAHPARPGAHDVHRLPLPLRGGAQQVGQRVLRHPEWTRLDVPVSARRRIAWMPLRDSAGADGRARP